MLTDNSIRERLNMKLEISRGYGNVVPVHAAETDEDSTHLEEIIECFRQNKAR